MKYLLGMPLGADSMAGTPKSAELVQTPAQLLSLTANSPYLLGASVPPSIN